MPIVNIELTDDETSRLDAIASNEKRARKNQAAILLMERVSQIETTDEPTDDDSQSIPAH